MNDAITGEINAGSNSRLLTVRRIRARWASIAAANRPSVVWTTSTTAAYTTVCPSAANAVGSRSSDSYCRRPTNSLTGPPMLSVKLSSTPRTSGYRTNNP